MESIHSNIFIQVVNSEIILQQYINSTTDMDL